MGDDAERKAGTAAGPVVVATLLGAGLVATGWFSADHLGRSLYDRSRPWLERQLSLALGHPLELGPYLGLRPWGVAIGASRFRPGPNDSSSLKVRSFTVGLDPLASLQAWTPTLQLTVKGAQLDLVRNAAGEYWVFGGTVAGQEPPRLNLKVRLADSMPVTISPEGLNLRLRGSVAVNLQERLVNWRLTAWQRPPRSTEPEVSAGRPAASGAPAGRIRANGRFQWERRELELALRLRQVQLEPLAGLLPAGSGLARPGVAGGRRLSGRADGRLSLSLRLPQQASRFRCSGNLRLRGLQLQDPQLPAPWQANDAQLRCHDDQIALGPMRWSMANWRGTAGGSLVPGRSFDLNAAAEDPQRGDRLQALIQGPWLQPSLKLTARVPLGKGTPSSPAPLALSADLTVDRRRALAVQLRRLQLTSGRSQLVAGGALWPRLAVRSQSGSLHPSLWSAAPWLGSLLGRQQPVALALESSGTLLAPRLQASLARQGRLLLNLDLQVRSASPRPGARPAVPDTLTAVVRAPAGVNVEGQPVLGATTAQLGWRDGLLRLDDLTAPGLTAQGRLPLRWQNRRGLVAGDLDLLLDLPAYPLQRLSPLVGARLFGTLGARGSLRGPLAALRPDLRLEVADLGSGSLQLRERWTGQLVAAASGSNLSMRSSGTALPGTLTASLDASWLPRQVTLQRQGGTLALSGSREQYRWQATGLPLTGLQLQTTTGGRREPLQGLLSGQGVVGLAPLTMNGQVRVERPALLGLLARELVADGDLRQGRYRLRGQVDPLSGGQLSLQASGSGGGPLQLAFEGRSLTSAFFEQVLQLRARTGGVAGPPQGRASDLGELAIDTLGGTIADQLAALAAAHARLEASAQAGVAPRPKFRADLLRGLVDFDGSLTGPSLAALRLTLNAKGHLWLKGDDRDQALQLEPFVVRLQGPLGPGRGQFALEGLSLGLLALITPVPNGLRGTLDLEGRFRIGAPSGPGSAPDPQFSAELALRDGSLNGMRLVLENAQVSLDEAAVSAQASLRGDNAADSVDLSARLPLDPANEGLRMRLSSRGDGLRFLTALGGQQLQWRKGSADLELLVRGSLDDPSANGFLRLRGGELLLADQEVTKLEATVLFDFEQLLVQEFNAQVGEKGAIKAAGNLRLFTPLAETKLLQVDLTAARLSVPRLNAQTDASLTVAGTLLRPLVSGEVAISRGKLNVQPGELAQSEQIEGGAGKTVAVKPVTVQSLMESNWDFQQPLVLLGAGVDTGAEEVLRSSFPDLSYFKIDDLRLKLGPDLEVVMPPVATFRTAGLLTLNGPVDSNLQARGVVRLQGGRLTLFTTTFTLDPDAPNVAVFTPSLGLVPFLDIALRTRVSNSLEVGRSPGFVSEQDLRGGFTPLDQLNLVRVVMKISGPADRIGESLELRSNPPLSQERLVALIGGNSLAGLTGGNAGAALATVLGQSLLSPLVSTITDALGQRVSFAIYPTYVVPTESQNPNRSNGRVPSQLVLATDFGLDLSDRINLSILAAPNRSDIPPQFTLRYQASDTYGLQGSVDAEGRWQTQLQFFFRF